MLTNHVPQTEPRNFRDQAMTIQKKLPQKLKKKDTKPKGLKTSSLTDKSHIIN